MVRDRTTRRLLIAGTILLAAACADSSQPVAPPQDAETARTPHGAAEIATLFRQASPEVMALPQTVFAAHDESAGVLVFGVENNVAAARVQASLERRGVPASAYRLQITPAIHYMSDNLRSRHRPTVGGLQIHWSNYVCTLGFNVDHPGGRSFITNSHCTNNQGSTGTTQYYQPASSTDPSAIAVEAHDPSYSRIAGCSAGKQCRYSDAARALYNSSASSTRGLIAKTTGLNTGSLVTNGHFTVSAQNNTATSFSGTVHKVGRTTGWTSGNVTSTCATVNVSGSNIQLLCQTLVQRSGTTIVQGGDSGSPVFQLGSNDNVTLVGILWGGSTSGDLFVFSPLKSIQDELGSLSATYDGSGGGGDPGDPPPTAPQASFTYNCNNGMTCQLTDTSTGGPTSWSWSMPGGEPNSASTQNTSTTYSSVGTYTVTLTVSNSSGSSAAQQSITCRQQGPNVRCR